MPIAPILMTPAYRCGEDTPWGGDGLGRLFGREIPDPRTGESLEVSAIPGVESRDRDGTALTALIGRHGERLTGRGFDRPFPLLLKLLDAREMLSVQVHPDDAYAHEHEGGKLGKTEAWLVIAAERGAKLVYGVNAESSEELRAQVEAGKLEESLRWVAVQPGDVLYIPHGCVHALGGGILIYEIQQSSDVTYRFWDWGRVGKDGRPRALHTQAALDVSRPELKLNKLPGATLIVTGGNGGGGMPSEAGVMREVLLAKGIGADRIAMEDQSDDTRANFTNVARMIDPANPIVIITTGCHMDRAVRLAGETGFRDVRRLPVPSEPVNAISNVLWEVVMALNHILTGR